MSNKDTAFKERTQDYLDRAIRHWDTIRRRGISPEEMLMATHYMDAFQSARESLIGEKLRV